MWLRALTLTVIACLVASIAAFGQASNQDSRSFNRQSFLRGAIESFRRRIGARRVYRDIGYVENPINKRQTLDLYVPRSKRGSTVPLVVWIHGGGWVKGSKEKGPFRPLLRAGFAVASINYRYATQARFPAQIHDCKAAIRWLRSNATRYRIDPDRIGVWGASAGGHLAALLAVTSGTDRFSQHAGSVSSDIQAACDWFGPVDLALMIEQKRKSGSSDGVPKLINQLIGGARKTIKKRARRASPIAYVRRDLPPILIVHGDRDKLVPLEQSQLFYRALVEKGAPATLKIVRGGHGIPGFGPKTKREVVQFFERSLGKQ